MANINLHCRFESAVLARLETLEAEIQTYKSRPKGRRRLERLVVILAGAVVAVVAISTFAAIVRDVLSA